MKSLFAHGSAKIDFLVQILGSDSLKEFREIELLARDRFYKEAITAMKAVVKKWRNSASVRIPSAVLQAAKLRLGDAVDVREESGRIVIDVKRGKINRVAAPFVPSV